MSDESMSTTPHFMQASLLRELRVSPFLLKRRSHPYAAFNEIVAALRRALREDERMAAAFAEFRKAFRGVVITQEDAAKLADLERRGANKSAIAIGTFPSAIGPGLALMYDAALATLRSTDRRIEPGSIGVDDVRAASRSMGSILPLIGAASVTALELALEDRDFGSHLSRQAAEVGNVYLDNWNGPCEDCEWRVTDEYGNTETICGTPKECEAMGTFFLVLLLVLLVLKLIDWIWD